MQEAPSGAGRGRVVIVVEDNERSRRLARDVLELSGFRAVGVETAEDLFAAVVLHDPAMVLMDIQLPGLDGVAAFHRLRGDPATAGIPVVAVTAYAMRGDEERFLAEGFDGYLSKPIDVRTFASDLLAILQRREG